MFNPLQLQGSAVNATVNATSALVGEESPLRESLDDGRRGVLELLLDANPASLSVLLLLVVLLFFTVWYILRKRLVLRRYEGACDNFERAFWGGGGIGALAARARGGEFGDGGMAKIFLAGQSEYDKQADAGVENPEIVLTGVRRAMDAAIQHENHALSRYMEFLASVAGVSPYIGLLGTVMGIINAFSGLVDSSQATIALVAPGIAEALVATAMGLVAAIPALLAFNHYNTRLERLDSRFETFADRYINILSRSL